MPSRLLSYPTSPEEFIPPASSGGRYPEGIPILPEDELLSLIKKRDVDSAVLSYSDLLYDEVMEEVSKVIAAGIDFMLLGPKSTMLKSKLPVVAICAVRTGAGKSTVTRRVLNILMAEGLNPVAVRHLKPYGDLAKQMVQRFVNLDDLDHSDCTIEERKEYEPLIRESLSMRGSTMN